MLTKENIKDICILSPMQEAMYFYWVYAPDSNKYFEQVCFRQFGKLKVEDIKISFNELIKRYEILRTVFIQKTTDRPIQVILKEREIDFYFEDIRDQADVEAYVNDFKEKDQQKSFNLEKDVLMRINILQLASDKYEIIWSWHHILMDAWCVGILQADFVSIYNNLQQLQQIPLPLVVPYKTYLQWLAKQDKIEIAKQWKAYLKNYEQRTHIPLCKVEHPKNQIANTSIVLEDTLSIGITQLSSKLRVTVNTIMQVAWSILLNKYNGKSDVVFGSVVSGRPSEIEGIDTMLGLFINTIPVRITSTPETTFTELVKTAQKKSLEMEAYHHLPLAEILASTLLKSDLFDHVMLFQNFPVNTAEPSSMVAPTTASVGNELKLQPTGVFQSYYYDFNIFVAAQGQMEITIKYNETKYESVFIDGILTHFRNILQQLNETADIKIKDISLLSKEQSHALHLKYQPREVPYALEKTFLEQFHTIVAKNYDSCALICGEQKITYGELNERANGLAAYLKTTHHIGAQDIVGLMTGRATETIVALLGILKAGAIFLPIDADLPTSRKHIILSSSETKLLLTDSAQLLNIDYYEGELFALDLQLETIAPIKDNPSIISDSQDLCYILFTSGSTGTPKGVEITHRSLSNYVNWSNDYYFDHQAGYHFPFFTPLTFDLTLTSIFTTLLRGDQLSIYGSDEVDKTLAEIFTNASINTIKLTPPHIKLLEHLNLSHTNISKVIVGGEQLTKAHVLILKNIRPDIEIFNEYGPTETTIGCSVKRITSEEEINVGIPIANTHIYILNDVGQIVPDVIEGEIVVGGEALARGYFKEEEMTQAKFMTDPFNPEKRLYKTGDLGRRLPNGEIEFIGRKDNQIKIRGFRIEIKEIESHLIELDSINDVVVIGRKQADQENYLIAYYISKNQISVSELRDTLKNKLPEYMIPAFFVHLEQLPLTANGKLNKKELPDPNDLIQSRPKIEPSNAAEKQLLDIWKEVLNKEDLSTDDDFFEIGGHSLNATQVISRVYKQLNIHVDLKDVFDFRTIQSLAKLISGATIAQYEEIHPAEPRELYPLSHAQKRLWMTEKLQDNLTAYIIPKAYGLRGELDRSALIKAFETLIIRHESLRTVFVEQNGIPFQKINTPKSSQFSIEQIDLRNDTNQVKTLKVLMDQEVITPFDLKQGPHFRGKLVQLEDQYTVLLITFHHIISDGWTMDIFTKEIISLYYGFSKGEDTGHLQPLNIQYKDYSVWHNDMLSSEKVGKQKQYWKEKLKDRSPNLSFPTDYPRTSKKTYQGDSVGFKIENSIYQQVSELNKAHETSMFMTILAFLKLLLFRYSGQVDITVGTVQSGRIHPDLEDQIGFYMNTLALRTQFDQHANFPELLKKVRQTTLEAFAHQAYPFDLIIGDINLSHDVSRSPLFDVVVSYQRKETATAHNIEFNTGKLRVEQYHVSKKSTIFDVIFDVTDTGEELLCDLTFNTDLFKRETVAILGERLQDVIMSVLADPQVKIRDIDFSGQEEPDLKETGMEQTFNFNFNF